MRTKELDIKNIDTVRDKDGYPICAVKGERLRDYELLLLRWDNKMRRVCVNCMLEMFPVKTTEDGKVASLTYAFISTAKLRDYERDAALLEYILRNQRLPDDYELDGELDSFLAEL